MRRLSLGLLAAAMLIAVPSGASAATTIGQTFAPTSVCGNTQLQTTSPGGQYTVPSVGVITRWSFQADRAPPQLKFKVARPAPGADLMSDADFTMIGESGLVTPVALTLNSYFVQVPVKPGDVIGLFNATGGNCERTASGSRVHFHSGDVMPPTTATFTKGGPFLLDLSALLEPDCDNDGLGDETQDKKLSSPSCPPPLTCKGKFLTIVGTDGPDEIVGTPSRDVIGALDGNDKVRGLDGKDLICAGKNRDTLKGGKSKDKLFGQKGRDRLRGGGARDVCKGGKGEDSASKCEVEKSI